MKYKLNLHAFDSNIVETPLEEVLKDKNQIELKTEMFDSNGVLKINNVEKDNINGCVKLGISY